MKCSRPLWPFICIAALIVILGVGGFFLLSPQMGGGAGSFPQWEKAAALEEETYPQWTWPMGALTPAGPGQTAWTGCW